MAIRQRSSAEVRARIRGYVEIWSHAIQKQAARALAADTTVDQEADVQLFAYALQNLRVAVRWAESEAVAAEERERASTLGKAMASFDAKISDATNVRDLVTHFDDYERGRGKLPISELSVWYQNDDVETTLRIHPYTLQVRMAAEEALKLADRAMEALY